MELRLQHFLRPYFGGPLPQALYDRYLQFMRYRFLEFPLNSIVVNPKVSNKHRFFFKEKWLVQILRNWRFVIGLATFIPICVEINGEDAMTSKKGHSTLLLMGVQCKKISTYQHCVESVEGAVPFCWTRYSSFDEIFAAQRSGCRVVPATRLCRMETCWFPRITRGRARSTARGAALPMTTCPFA